MKTKTELRKQYLALRRAISPDERAQWNQQIRARLLQLPEMQGQEDIYIYISSDDEVDTRSIVEELLRRGRRILAPIPRDAGRMDWGLVSALDRLKVGRFGLLEPGDSFGSAREPHCGTAIVPCVAFGVNGERLGRGGGFFDRFLATFIGPTIALAYALQRADSIPCEAHDLKTDLVVTDGKVYRPDSELT